MVRQIAVGPMANFTYLVVEEASNEAMVVDSGWETEPTVKAVDETGAKVAYVVATHGHFDHVSTLGKLARQLGAETVAHESSRVDADLKVGDGNELSLGSGKVRVLHTPGHTQDSVCLYDDAHVFTGDTLFVGSIGRFESESAEEIFTSLHRVILRLPPSTMMYPGHDYGEVKCRTLEEESRSNPFLVAKDFKSFASLLA